MRNNTRFFGGLGLAGLATTAAFAQGGGGGGQGGRGGAAAPPMPMSFFITSAPKGDGANYGGLAGADAYCQQLGAGAGRGGVTWPSHLSQQAKNGMPAVHARDRIRNGPWDNQPGPIVAPDLRRLHRDNNDQARGSHD